MEAPAFRMAQALTRALAHTLARFHSPGTRHPPSQSLQPSHTNPSPPQGLFTPSLLGPVVAPSPTADWLLETAANCERVLLETPHSEVALQFSPADRRPGTTATLRLEFIHPALPPTYEILVALENFLQQAEPAIISVAISLASECARLAPAPDHLPLVQLDLGIRTLRDPDATLIPHSRVTDLPPHRIPLQSDRTAFFSLPPLHESAPTFGSGVTPAMPVLEPVCCFGPADGGPAAEADPAQRAQWPVVNIYSLSTGAIAPRSL
jgi:hypothetical protein